MKTIAEVLAAFPKDSAVAEGLRLVERLPADPPPRDEVGDARRAKETDRQRQLRAWCQGWGVPLSDAQRILTGEVLDTPPLAAAKKLHGRAEYGAILCLSGPNGCGKSFASSWLVAQGPPRSYPYGDAWPAELHPRFLSAGDLLRVSMYDDDAWRAICRASVLAVDDLGTEFNDKSGAFAARFDQLIAYREKGPCWTVLTTNLLKGPIVSPTGVVEDSFSGRYGERVIDRISRGGSAFLHFHGKSLRQPDVNPRKKT